jgi:hypothetical protein
MVMMKKRFMAACVMAIALAFTTGWAVAGGDAPATAAIGPQYAQLARLAGPWTVQQSMWTAADAAPVIDRGSATYAMVLDGRHLRQELHIASGKPFEGLGYIGYDDVMGKYYSSWMDSNFAGVILAYGTYDAASRTYQFAGEMAAKGGAPVTVRELMRVTDGDHFVYEYYETRGGKEALAIRLQYTRLDG